MDINEPSERIEPSASVVAWFQTLQPEDPVSNSRIHLSLPGESSRFAASKDGAGKSVSTDLGRDPVQTKWGAQGVHDLAGAVSRGGNPEQVGAVQAAWRIQFQPSHTLMED